MNINFDDNPDQTSWEIFNDSGDLVASSYGTYALGMTDAAQGACLADGCYELVVSDSAGDGMCPRRTSTVLTGINIATLGLGGVFNGIPRVGQMCGNYTLTDANGTELASGGGRFGTSETNTFCISGGVAEINSPNIGNSFQSDNDTATPGMTMRPNLVKDQLTLTHTLESAQTLQWTIIDMTGKIIRQETFDSNTRQLDINVSDLHPGFYFMQLTDEQLILTEKFIKN